MRLLILLPLLAVATAHVEHFEKRSQPGVSHPDPANLRPLEWGELNVISTTDTHGWLAGHVKENSYSADFGDFASFLSHMREQAYYRRKDLLVVDSGDLHDGNGLADATPVNGQISNPIFQKINYDALAIGNHEMYENDVAENVFRNFAPKWGKKYLTSNVFFKDSHSNKTVPFGNLYNKFRMRFGTRVMSYGFLYNFKGGANNTVVEPANVTVTLPWFQKSLKEDVDVYLVVGHVPVRWSEAQTVVKAIRAVHPSKPILVFGGHLHIRDFTSYDGRAYGLSAGRFMETLGWMSSNCIGKNLTVSRRYLDTNVHTYKTHSLAHPRQRFDTWRGRKISSEVTKQRKALGLTKVLGCAPQDYYLNRYPYTDSRSLLNLVVNDILPFSVTDKKRPYPSVIIINSGSQRFDVFKGEFTVDDTYIVSPFYNDFVYTTVPYKVAKNVLNALNKAPFQKRADDPFGIPALGDNNSTLTPGYVTKDDYGYGGDDWPHSAIPYVPTPNYVSSPLPSGLADGDLVDVAWLTYFSNLVGPILKTLDPANNYTFQTYNAGITTNNMWPIFVQGKWSNSTTC
ncbi:Metallo-dependent phosphatase-like protein [Lobosporangium transversale]|uniref:Metallo-dependent phosphatase-like protein n=1 Tax=Lobosporangium transversale TaxID=64571 RepID=A0A1Y2GUU0_9FUNG|nr:Metallo-dependent phosphatase-like protein [Lobosporangium transversale]ORZ22805.1 Metallo-dependent phosphatase-like protein [Lobosporangium transversale]|eukprot:XP_021883359.1 Metallo-dependent phosphatase-like protein [Lobosporangium transversale]